MSQKEMHVRFTGVLITQQEYRYFYSLANELAHKSWTANTEAHAHRYAVGAVIMSYTCLEAYFNHIFLSSEYTIRQVIEGMSPELHKRIERLSLFEKLEFAHRFHAQKSTRKISLGKEPFQSFDLLRQLRNLLIHYTPEKELVWSETGAHLKEIHRLEKKISGRYYFLPRKDISPLDSQKTVTFRIYNRECAKWAFCCIDPVIDAIAGAFDIYRTKMERGWDFPDAK